MADEEVGSKVRIEAARDSCARGIPRRVKTARIASVSLKDRFLVTCPDCGGSITVDAATGEVLAHRSAAKKTSPGKDFDTLFAGLGEAKSRAEEVFEQQVNAVRNHERLMEEKFREALKRAEEEKDEGPPKRPWDFE